MRNLSIEADIAAKQTAHDTEQNVNSRVKAEIQALTAFIINQLGSHPEALKSLQQALKSEYGQ